MLPKRLLTPRSRWFWLAFLVLAPFAYLAGFVLISRYDPVAQTDLTFARNEAIELGTRYAAERGLDVRGWDAFLSAKANNSLLFYYRIRPGEDTARIRAIAPSAWVRLLFRSSDGAQNILFTLTPDGKVTNVSHTPPASTPVPTDPGDARARAIAEATLQTWLQPSEIAGIKPPEVKVERNDNRVTRQHIWMLPFESRPELNLKYYATVTGDQVTRQGFESNLSDTFLRQHRLFGGFSFTLSGTRISGIAVLNLVLFYLVVAIVFVFGLYRFIQRARQRELSPKRIAILTVVIAVLFLSIILLTDIATFDSALNSRSTLLPIYIFGSISYLFMGLIVALAYGSGEGDLREKYPGKLTSLDALLTGKILSRNVARSVVIGCAFAGWGLFLINLVPFFWRNQPAAGKQIEMLEFLVGRLPWFSPLVIWPFYVVFTSILGLLLPLPFLSRRFRSRKLILVLLAVFAWIAGTGSATDFTPWLGAALIGAVHACLLLVPFFKFDVLTALVSLAGTSYVTSALHFVAQPSTTLRNSGLISLAIGLVFLAVQILFVYKGRLYRSDEVGPQYARFLAERLSMQAEVSAAREAQIRLLPQTLPQSPQFSIAAECRPAHEVGGDFYEVFQLDDDRVGIFMAEGGGMGLASALSIAFAKGFLMPKISGSSRGDDSPTEIVRSLQSRLLRTIDRDLSVGLVYCVVDSSDRTVRYARTGVFPRVIVGREAKSVHEALPATPEEQETTFLVKSVSTGETDEAFTVVSGMSEINPGDCLVLFTDGIAAAISEGKQTAAGDIWQEISSHPLDSPLNLQKAVHRVLESTSKRAQKLGIQDDLTALVVRVNAESV